MLYKLHIHIKLMSKMNLTLVNFNLKINKDYKRLGMDRYLKAKLLMVLGEHLVVGVCLKDNMITVCQMVLVDLFLEHEIILRECFSMDKLME